MVTANVGSTTKSMTAQQLIDGPRRIGPHVVLLGAGASRAAFPNGDANGKGIPIMNDLVDVLDLRPLIRDAGLEMEHGDNFEAIYSRLFSNSNYERVVRSIEHRIEEYFSNLALPYEATIYDRLLISLRSTDAVITFNWDPFLFDAYQRNRYALALPEIVFLHGNVRIGACGQHDSWGARNERCSQCCQQFTDVPLLYPIKQKNYSSNPYIHRNWEAAKVLFSEAFTITIFGYSAPVEDADAVELLQEAWMEWSARTFEHIEIIDIASESLLHTRWSPFTPTLHYRVVAAFEQSRIARWPRRSCESLLYPSTQGIPCQDFPLPSTNNLADLQVYAMGIAEKESILQAKQP